MPWRQDTRPYYILVSEIMLQQTQVDRVIPKFLAFIQRFPNEKALASAPLADVLQLWNGLGYNRRAKFLHDAAKKIINEYNSIFPTSYETLLKLPGVGKGTAGAIVTYAYNVPHPFIETNVRSVYFYHFFDATATVSDAELLPLLQQTIDHEHPREFYWALMDYGSWLKRNGAGQISQSHHYKKQSALKGSLREMRGIIVRELTKKDWDEQALQAYINDERYIKACDGLMKDGLVVRTNKKLHLTK